MIKLVSHINGDLDSRCSLWLYERFISKSDCAFRFVPANWDGKDEPLGTVILDVDANGLGLKGKIMELPGGGVRVMSCFATLLNEMVKDEEVRAILMPLCELVEAQDSTGDGLFEVMRDTEMRTRHRLPEGVVRLHKLTPGDVPAAIRATGLLDVMAGVNFTAPRDLEAPAEVLELQRYQAFRTILDGLFLVWRHRFAAAPLAAKAKWFGKVALIEGGSPAVNGILFEQGAQLIVYHDGNNLGIVRGRTLEAKLVKDWARALVERLAPKEERERWFYHPSGFLTAHGSIKAPASSPSSIPAGALAEELAKLIAPL